MLFSRSTRFEGLTLILQFLLALVSFQWAHCCTLLNTVCQTVNNITVMFHFSPGFLIFLMGLLLCTVQQRKQLNKSVDNFKVRNYVGKEGGGGERRRGGGLG